MILYRFHPCHYSDMGYKPSILSLNKRPLMKCSEQQLLPFGITIFRSVKHCIRAFRDTTIILLHFAVPQMKQYLWVATTRGNGSMNFSTSCSCTLNFTSSALDEDCWLLVEARSTLLEESDVADLFGSFDTCRIVSKINSCNLN